MSLPYSISTQLSLEEFREIAQKQSQKIEVIHATLDSASTLFHNDPGPSYKHCEALIHSVLSLRDAIQTFSSLLNITYLPFSVYELRSPLLNTLYFVHEQTETVVLQLFSFKDTCHTVSERSLLLQLKIQRRIEAILQETQNAIIEIGLLPERARFLENGYKRRGTKNL